MCFPSCGVYLSLSNQAKKSEDEEKAKKVENPDQVDTLPYVPDEQFQDSQAQFSPVPPMKSLSPSPSPPILKKSSQYSMVTTLDAEEDETHEKAEEEKPTHDACVCPDHGDVVIDIESDEECLMSPSKPEKQNMEVCTGGSMPEKEDACANHTPSEPLEKKQRAESGPKDMDVDKPMGSQNTPAETQTKKVHENDPEGNFDKFESQLGSDDEMGQGATKQAFKVCVVWVGACIDSCIVQG